MALPGSVRVVVQPDGAASFAVDVARLETQDDGTHLWLDPGRHHLEFKRGNLSLKHEVVIAVGESSQLRVDLAPKPTPVAAPVRPRTMRPVFPARAWFVATGSLAGANLVAGVSFVAMGSAEFHEARATADDACEPTSALRRCHAALVRPTLHRGLGAGVLGVGLGVLAGSLTALAPTDVARRRVWYGELGGGLILAAAGSAVLGVYVKRFNHTNSVVDAGSPPWSDAEHQADIATTARGYIASAALVGAGVGLAVSAAAGLLVQRYARSPRSTRWQIHSRGVAVRF